MSQRAGRIAVQAILTTGICVLFLKGAFERPELPLYDWRMTALPFRNESAPLVLVGITERFPEVAGEEFSRKHHARLLSILQEEGASVVGFDIFFPDRKDPREDSQLIEAVRRSSNVVLPVFCPVKLSARRGDAYLVERLSGSFPELEAAAAAVGHISTLADADAAVRRMPVSLELKSGSSPIRVDQISLVMAGMVSKAGSVPMRPMRGFPAAGRGVPVGEDGCFYINYPPPETMRAHTVAFEGVLLGRYPKGFFRGKAVLVAQTALGAKNADLLPTPLGIRFGAYVQAAALWTVLTGRTIWRIDRPTVCLLLIVAGLVLAVLYGGQTAGRTTLVLVISLAAVLLWSILWFRRGVFLDTVPFLVLCLSSYVVSVADSLRRALAAVVQKDEALRMLKGVEGDIAGLLTPAKLTGLADRYAYSRLDTANLVKETPEIALRAALAALGVQSGVLFVSGVGTAPVVIASCGEKWREFDLPEVADRIRKAAGVPVLHSGAFKKFCGGTADSVMVLSLVTQPTSLVAGLFINKIPTVFSRSSSFSREDARLAEILCYQTLLAIQNAGLSQALAQAQEEMIIRLAMAVEYRDRETGAHIHRVSAYAGLIARGIGLPPAEEDLIRNAMPMHDIGKIAVPDSVLLKPDNLTPDERRIMEQHTIIGAQMLAGSSSLILQAAEIIALSHQERFDGSGYPYHLKRRAIPLYGRIAALADVFDAMTSRRVYKEAVGLEEGFREVTGSSGRLFDPDVVDGFLRMRGEIEATFHTYREKKDAEHE